MKKTVVVTGAAGYIGGQTALMLADLGHRVVDIISGVGEQWNRAGNRYRDHTAHEKYQVVKVE